MSTACEHVWAEFCCGHWWDDALGRTACYWRVLICIECYAQREVRP